MDKYFLSADKGDGALLCIAPLTNRQISVADQEIDDANGLYLFEQSGRDNTLKVNVIARILSEDAVLMFQRQFSMS